MTSSVTTKSDTPVVLDSMSILVTPPMATLVDLELWGMKPCITIISHLLDMLLAQLIH